MLPSADRSYLGRIVRPTPKRPTPARFADRAFTRAQTWDKIITRAQQQDYAMAEACDIHGTAFKNGSVTLLARIVGAGGANIVPADVYTAKYTVYLLDDQNPDSRTAVAEHANVALTVADVVFATLQTDPMWTVDAIGYNFRHVLDVSVHQAFAVAGRRYLVEYQLAPAVGQTIFVRFRINVI